MRLSIITVTYNNREGLERTFQSIDRQNCKDFEYIVVDGASSDGSVEVIRKYEHCITKWVSEVDTGIYNAMNKGVRLSSGEYCLFINSGDELYSPSTIQEILNEKFDEDFVQGIIYRNNGRKEMFVDPPKEVTLSFYIYGNNNYHQASLISRKLLLSHPYDEKYRIAADYKFNIECLVKYNCSFRPIYVVIAKYEYGGRSVSVRHDQEPYIIYRELFPQRILNDYVKMEYCFRFPIKYIMPILEKIGRLKCFRSRYKAYGGDLYK